MNNWILETVRVRSTRRVTAWGLLGVCFLLFGAWQTRYVRNFLAGPYEFGPAELDSIADVTKAPRYFARVTGSEALDTGLQQISVRKRNGVETGRSVSAGYYALVVGDKLLVCKSQSGSQTTFEGQLMPIPSDLEHQLFDSPDMAEVRGRFYAFYLNDESFRSSGYWGVVGLLVFGGCLLGFGLPAWKHMKDPTSHPLAARVEEWGDPIGVAAAAESEVDSPHFKAAGWLVTRQFLIRSTFFTIDLLRLCDLLWAYKKVTKNSINFIPTGKTHEVLLICYGGGATIQSSEKTVDDILAFASQRTPWAIFGYSKELEDHFDKGTAEFCAAVEERKLEWAGGARAQAEA